MVGMGSSAREAALRLYRDRQEAICDSVERWDHGVVAKASRYPDYWDFNLIRVEDDPGMSAAELAEFADEVLGDFGHRRIDFELVDAGERVRGDLERLGWLAERLLWMRREETRPPAGSGVTVREVPYEEVHGLRSAWQEEDFPGVDQGDYLVNAREVATKLGARVFAVEEDGEEVAFAQLEGDASRAEVTQVYVHPDHRGGGLGTALTAAAMREASDVDDLWICADDLGRPKELYARLGFRPVLTTFELTRLPRR